MLGFIGVSTEAEAEHLRGAGHLGDALAHKAAGAALGGSNGQLLFGEGLHQGVLQVVCVLAVDHIPQNGAEFFRIGPAGRFALPVAGGPGGNANLHLAGLCVDGSGGILVLKQVAHLFLHVALADAGDAQRQAMQHPLRPIRQEGPHLLGPQGF